LGGGPAGIRTPDLRRVRAQAYECFIFIPYEWLPVLIQAYIPNFIHMQVYMMF